MLYIVGHGRFVIGEGALVKLKIFLCSKTFKKILVLLFCLNSSAALARLTDGKSKISVEQKKIIIKPLEQFHLNVEAPAQVTFDSQEVSYKPLQKTEKMFVFAVVDQARVARLAYYVCDDKKTVCEQHQEKINLSGSSFQTKAKMSQPLVAEEVSKQKVGQNSQSTQLKSLDGRPTLLVFSAPWCPACIRMQTETYHQPSVQKWLKQVNFKKLNSDLVENYELSERFHVKAIPTVILLNPEGEEIYRWLDFQPATSFSKSLQLQILKNNDSKLELQKKASLGDTEAISRLAFLYYNSLEYSEAIKWFSLSKKEKDLKYKLAAEVSDAQEKADEDESFKKDYLTTLEKAILLTTSSIDRWRWFADWVDQKKSSTPLSAEIQIKVNDIIRDLDKLIVNNEVLRKSFLESTYGDAQGFEMAEALLMRAHLFVALDQKKNAEDTYMQLTQFILKKKLSVDKPGEMLMAIAYLREAHNVQDVEKLYQKLIQHSPNSYVYYEKYARFQLKEKKADQALGLVEKALQYPEGNDPQLFLLKARILKELNQTQQLKDVLEQAFQYKEINHERFKKTLAQLKKIKDDIK